jgi:hypothetical protein
MRQLIPLKFDHMPKQKGHVETYTYNFYMILQKGLGFLGLVPFQVMTKLASVVWHLINVTSLNCAQSSEVRKTLAAPSCAAHQYSRYVAFVSL